jgi:hypothetical protein
VSERTEEFILHYSEPEPGVHEVREVSSRLRFTGTSRQEIRDRMIEALSSWDGTYWGAVQPVDTEEKVYIVRRSI